MNEFKRRILVDFDGVIYLGDGGQTSLSGEPVQGAFEFLKEFALADDYELVVYSGRCLMIEAVRTMKAWFLQKGLPIEALGRMEFSGIKLPAWIFIDDRGWHFNGFFPTREQIDSFKPWHQREQSGRTQIGTEAVLSKGESTEPKEA